MKHLTILAAAALLALPALALVPTASADACSFQDPELEPVVCAGPNAAACVLWAASEPKDAVRILLLCDAPLFP